MEKKLAHRRQTSTLFDLELDDCDGDKDCVVHHTLKELLRSFQTDNRNKLLRVAEQCRGIALNGDAVDLQTFAEAIAAHNYPAWLRTGRPQDKGSLRHTFVVVAVPGSEPDTASSQLFVVEPCFKDHFLLSNATPAYQALWDELPTLFVGTADQVVAVVELMCTQMQLVFVETCSSCPPWRQPASMISKWLPCSADDVPVLARDASACSARAGNYSVPLAAFAAPDGLAPISELRRTGSSTSNSSNGGQPGVGELVYTPRATKAPYYDRNDSSGNVLLSGSLVGLGQSPGVLAGSSAGMGGFDAVFYGCGGDVSCIVHCGSSPDSWTGKAGYFGAASWTGIEEDVGGVAIRHTLSDCGHVRQLLQRNELVAAAAAKPSTAFAAAAAPVRAAAPAPAAAGASGLAPLDIARFNSDIDDVDFFSPRAAKAEQQTAHVPHVPQKRRSRGGILGQSSALSAAIAGNAIGRA